MRPANCYLCEKGLDTGDNCELVIFTKSPQDIIESSRKSNPDIYPVSNHPDNMEWFCLEKHYKLAKQFVHLTYKEAIGQLESILAVNRKDKT